MNPGADKYVSRMCLVLTIYHCLNSVYGEEGWTQEGRSVVGSYWREWDTFKTEVFRGKIKLALPAASTTAKPTVGNFGLAASTHSQFGLDAQAEFGFPLANEEES